MVVADGDIGRGQNVWQSLGGMEVGSIWGHGSYVAPDWTADWLHREATFVLNDWAAAEYRQALRATRPPRIRRKLRGRLEDIYRHNGYDAATNTIRIEPVRARAFEACLTHFSDVFIEGQHRLRDPAGQRLQPGTDAPVRRLHVLDRLVRCRRTAPATPSPIPTTGRTNRWSATAPPAKA